MSNQRQQQQRAGGKAPFTEGVPVPVPAPTQEQQQAVADLQDEVAKVKQAEEASETVAAPAYVFAPPYYDFAGANLGGQSVYVCGACHCIVLRDNQIGHTGWHEATETALYATGR